MSLLTYLTEYENEDGKIVTREFGGDLQKARAHARRLTKGFDNPRLAYVIACTASDRIGGECYAYGRRDHVDGVMAA